MSDTVLTEAVVAESGAAEETAAPTEAPIENEEGKTFDAEYVKSLRQEAATRWKRRLTNATALRQSYFVIRLRRARTYQARSLNDCVVKI